MTSGTGCSWLTPKRGKKAAPKSKPGRRRSPDGMRKVTTTKRGPGRRHKDGVSHIVERVKEPGGYGKGLVAAWTRQRLHAIEKKKRAARNVP